MAEKSNSVVERLHLRVAEINVYPPQIAMISRPAFESIADKPLYLDRRRASNVPPLTLRELLKSAGPRQARQRRVRLPFGLVKRVTAMLTAAGWHVVTLPDESVQYLSRHRTPDDADWRCPRPLRAAYGRATTLLQLPSERDRLQVVVALREQYPDAHQLIVAKNKRTAKQVAQKLQSATGQPVTWGSEPLTRYPRWHVDAIGTFTGRSVQDWAFVTLLDAELVASHTSLMQLGHMFASIRLGLLVRDERSLNEADRALVESMFGPVVYRAGQDHDEQTELAVAWLTAAAYPAADPRTPLERKRRYFWLNDSRNRLIAAAAHALATGDSRTVAELGFSNAAEWLLAENSGHGRISSSVPLVAVIVENVEHGRELVPLLPGWRLVALNNIRANERLLSGNMIVTLACAAECTFATDVLFYAAAVGDSWFDTEGPSVIGITPERMLVIDVADDCDPQAVQDTHARRADYDRRGWTADRKR